VVPWADSLKNPGRDGDSPGKADEGDRLARRVDRSYPVEDANPHPEAGEGTWASSGSHLLSTRLLHYALIGPRSGAV
jgi:hypothetical protein